MKFLYDQSNFKEDFFRLELVRPFVSDFCKFSYFRYFKIITFLRACSDLYAHAKHTGQELMRALSMHIRN